MDFKQTGVDTQEISKKNSQTDSFRKPLFKLMDLKMNIQYPQKSGYTFFLRFHNLIHIKKSVFPNINIMNLSVSKAL